MQVLFKKPLESFPEKIPLLLKNDSFLKIHELTSPTLSH